MIEHLALKRGCMIRYIQDIGYVKLTSAEAGAEAKLSSMRSARAYLPQSTTSMPTLFLPRQVNQTVSAWLMQPLDRLGRPFMLNVHNNCPCKNVMGARFYLSNNSHMDQFRALS